MSCPTILDVVLVLEPGLAELKEVSAGAIMAHGFPFMGGCQVCGATVSAGNACLGRNHYLVGSCCATPENAFATVEEVVGYVQLNS